MKQVTFTCDVCKTEYSHECASVRFNEHARQVGGGLVYSGHAPVDWPKQETYPDLCPECSIAVIETLQERIE